MSLLTFTRRSTLAALSLLVLAACGSATGENTALPSDTALNDMVLGDPNAPVTLIEYASVTCGACYQFHQEVLPTIKERFVDQGHVKFVFREFPTAPLEVALAGFSVARCTGPDNYFDMVEELFDNQRGILQASQIGAHHSAILAIAERYGVEGEEAYRACINNREIRQAIADVVMSGEDLNVSQTPTLFLQGEKLENNLRSRTPEGLSALIEAELTALGIVVETPAEDSTDVPTESN